MAKTLWIATDFQTMSYSTVADNIAKTLAKHDVQCVVRHWQNMPDNIHQVLVVCSAVSQALNYLWRFDENTTSVLLYITTEGHPILSHMDLMAANRSNVQVIVPSLYVKQCLEDMGIGVDAVVPHALPMKDPPFSDVFYQALKEKFEKFPDVVTTVAHNNVRKGLDKLLLSFKMLEYIDKDAYLILHSGESPKGYMGVDIRRTLKGLDLQRVWYTATYGGFSEVKVNVLYKMAKVLAFPSLAEGFGLPLIEAYRMGVPVVAIDAPPMNEIVENGKTGVLVPSTETYTVKMMEMMNAVMHDYKVDDFTSALLAILTVPDFREKLIAGIEEAKWKWDSDRVYTRFLEWIKG